MPMGFTKALKIFITGVKFTLMFQRLIRMDSAQLGHLPVHWRLVVGGSSIFSRCSQEDGVVSYRIRESTAGDVTLLSPNVGFSLCNTAGGAGGSILMKKYRCEDYAKVFRDTHGTLQPGYKSCHEVELWVPIKKWLSREDSSSCRWSYSLYMSLMLELGGSGNKYDACEVFGGFGGSCTIYYK